MAIKRTKQSSTNHRKDHYLKNEFNLDDSPHCRAIKETFRKIQEAAEYVKKHKLKPLLNNKELQEIYLKRKLNIP